MAAAWAVRQAHPDAVLHARRINDPVPDCIEARDDVIIVDYSYDRATFLELRARVASSIMLDHHATAQRAMAGLPDATFDMDRSGAGMAWDHFMAGTPRPWLIDYVEDNDLWRHKLPGSRAVAAVLRMTHFTIEAYTALAQEPLAAVVARGELILQYEESIIRAARRSARQISIGGYNGIPCTNSLVCQSDIGHALAADAPFAIVWYVRNDGKAQLSFRSRSPDGADVAAIAETLGGGGHKHSAGVTLELADFAQRLA